MEKQFHFEMTDSKIIAQDTINSGLQDINPSNYNIMAEPLKPSNNS